MSSTNRGSVRNISDYYRTPTPIIINFLKEFNRQTNFINPKYYFLDPCAGGDSTNSMSYPEALKIFGCISNVDTLDIRDDSKALIKDDFLSYEFNKNYDIVITNPPLALALPIIHKALQITNNNGYVIMLLRLNFFESKERFEFYKQYMPEYAFVHYKRISFTPDGKTDSICYAHFVWQKGNNPEFCKLKVI